MTVKQWKVDQPPIDREVRPSERRSLVWGLAVSVLGAILILCAVILPVRVGPDGGKAIAEWQLVRAAASGTLQSLSEDPEQSTTEPTTNPSEVTDDFCPT